MTRVAYLLKKFPRLSETFVLNEILEQERRGSAVHVFSRRTPDDEPRHPALAELRSPVETLPHPREADPWAELFREDHAPDLLSRLERVVRDGRRWNHPRFPSLVTEALILCRRFEELDIEHVHVHFATDSALVAWMVHALGGPGYSITAHAKDIYRHTVDYERLDQLVRDSRFTVTVCDANVEHLAARVGEAARSKLRRLYNGIDLSSFDGAPEDEREAHHILAVGRLVQKKGFHVFLDALACLRERGVPFEATLVGQGEDEERLAAQLAALDLGSRVRLAGPQDADQVRALMRRATVLCQPCVVGEDGNQDALPTVLIEAQAMGLCTVSTPVGGIEEILDGGRAGRLVPCNDPEATAAALAELLASPAQRADLARAGRERCQALFDRREAGRVLGQWFDALLPEGAHP